MPVVTPTELVRRLQSPPPTIPPEITAAAHPPNPGRRGIYAAASLGLIALVLGLVLRLVEDPGFATRARPAAPVEGLTIFAVFFVGALAVERLLEPIAGILLSKSKQNAEAEEKASTAAGKIADAARTPDAARMPDTAGTVARDAAARSAATTEANDAVQAAAEAKAELADRVWARTVVYWALASGLGIYVSAAMKLYLLRTVGIGDADRWLEVLATGLIIGAGTKPLHDLTKLITAQKEAKQTAA
jgi:hypothetical protein